MRGLVSGWVAAALLLGSGAATAEPWLAVREGLACGSCHFNPSGGGLRSAFGIAYAQQQLPARALGAEEPAWTGTLTEPVRLGADARASARQAEQDDRDDHLDFGVDRVSLYLGAELGMATLYVDQQVAPGGSLNREAWARLDWNAWYLKAGRLFLPFGWRLEDDTALVREVTGVNMTQGDDGLELGYEAGRVSVQLAATNGNGGGPEQDDGKLFTARAALVQPTWQIGLSGYRNDTDNGDRTIGGVFAGLRTGPVVWLAEVDHVDDRPDDAPEAEQQVALLEANVALGRGHNLKLTAEGLFPDEAEDLYRFSAVYEWFPAPYTQLRLGVRARDSDDEAAELNSEQAFVQIHVFL